MTLATERNLTGFGAMLWRSWLIANFAVYFSSLLGIFTQYGFQMPAGPENVFAVLTPSLQMLLGSALIVQPLLFITIMIGLVVCLPLGRFIFLTLGDNNDCSLDAKSGSSGKWSMSQSSRIFSILIVTIGYSVLAGKGESGRETISYTIYLVKFLELSEI